MRNLILDKFHWKQRDSVGPSTTPSPDVSVSKTKISTCKIRTKIEGKKRGEKKAERFRMATAVLRRPLLAAAAAASSTSSSFRPSRFHLRRCRYPPPVFAVSSDSPKPVTSSSTGGDNPDEEPVLPLLQELAVSTLVAQIYVWIRKF